MKKRTNVTLFVLAITLIIMLGCVYDTSYAQTPLDEGTQLFEQGRYDDAIAKYQEYISSNSDNAVAYNMLGMAYRFKFNQAGAQEYKNKEIESFEKAVELDSKYWVAYKNLAASLYYQGRKQEAVPYLERALELQPNDSEKEILLQWIEEGKS